MPEAARDAGAQIARFHRLGAVPPFADGQRRWEDFILAARSTDAIKAVLRERGR
jgi:hypothetical protein